MTTYTEQPPAIPFPTAPLLTTAIASGPPVPPGSRPAISPILQEPNNSPSANPLYYNLVYILPLYTRINDKLTFELTDQTFSSTVIHTRTLDLPLLNSYINYKGSQYWYELLIKQLITQPGTYDLRCIHSNSSGQQVGISNSRTYLVT
ncbi:hypothetical protein [Pseudomonas glycinae]|uniref:hypothetical protein n=1 Tax=Pseudomonas glycinae TaxID=1785145 RepID=UPI001F1573E1|nr:hypothetical protein [Pseudomonas glycinae]